MITRLKKIFHIFILVVLFLGIKSTFASETFNNNLLKAELHKTSLGGVKMVLFTGKPYNDAVSINKKSANEYVVLLPETSNSLTAKPNLKFVSDVIKNVEVKSQSYQNNIKGYTKIIIHSNKPIDISANVQTVAPVTYKLSENEYKELLSQAKSKSSSVSKAKSAGKQVLSAKKQVKPKIINIDKSGKTSVATAVTNASKTIKPAKAKVKVVQASSSKTAKIASQKPAKFEPVQKVIASKKQINKPVVAKAQVAEKSFQQSNTQTTLPEKNVQEQAQKLSQQIAETAPVNSKVVEPEHQYKLLSLSFIKHKISKLIILAQNNVYYAGGLIIAFFLVLLLFARKISSGIKNSKTDFVSNLQDSPVQPVNYEEKITDDMTWKEKFKACSDENINSNVAEQDLSSISNVAKDLVSKLSANQEEKIDELFNTDASRQLKNVEETEITAAEVSDSNVSEVFADVDMQTNEEGLDIEEDDDNLDEYFTEEDSLGSELSADDVFNDEDIFFEEQDENLIQPSLIEPSIESEDLTDIPRAIEEIVEPEPENNVVKSEFIIDDEKAIYLVDYEENSALVGRINEDFFVLKKFDTKIKAPLKARLNEQNLNSVSYMTKVGGFRGVVEVTPVKMDLLIEL